MGVPDLTASTSNCQCRRVRVDLLEAGKREGMDRDGRDGRMVGVYSNSKGPFACEEQEAVSWGVELANKGRVGVESGGGWMFCSVVYSVFKVVWMEPSNRLVTCFWLSRGPVRRERNRIARFTISFGFGCDGYSFPFRAMVIRYDA